MILPEKSVLENRRHSEIEINYVVKGRGEFICNGERSLVGEGGRRPEPFLPPRRQIIPVSLPAPDRSSPAQRARFPTGSCF